MSVKQIEQITEEINDLLQKHGIDEFHCIVPVTVDETQSVASLVKTKKTGDSSFKEVSEAVTEIFNLVLL